jgi:hypothetical protein
LRLFVILAQAEEEDLCTISGAKHFGVTTYGAVFANLTEANYTLQQPEDFWGLAAFRAIGH